MTIRVGIPRALQVFEYYPFWRTFFGELGAEIVLSPPTNREIVTAGSKIVADVTCLPVKVYAGHLIWLRDHGNVDFVYAPAIWSMEKDAFHCAKFKGLPDILKATVPNCPPLLDIEIDPQNRRLTAENAFRRMGTKFTWNPIKIQRAWARAGEADRIYRNLTVDAQITYPEALAHLYGDEWPQVAKPTAENPTLTIGLVGHPYCLYDDYINHNLSTHLSNMGVRVLTSEMVSAADALTGVKQTTGQVIWFYDRWVSGAAGHFLHRPDVDGVITALAFACGPDSTMAETITRRSHALQRSCLSLILDEHGSATGMVTRLEAFVDMLLRQKKPVTQTPSAYAPTAPPEPVKSPPVVLRQSQQPVLGIPRLGTTIIPLKSLFRGIGAQLELGPPASSHTIMLGARSSPEFICTPYKQILGSMIEMIEAGADTVLYVDGLDMCRNSAYHQLLHDALHDLGYKFRLMTFSQLYQGGAFALPKFLSQFVPGVTWRDVLREFRLALAKMAALDEIERRVQFIRPREVDQGSVDKVWDSAMLRLDDVTEFEALQPVKLDIHKKIDAISIDPTRRPVRIATTGEYYAILDPFYNLDLERELGRLGAEVHRTLMMSDWMRGTLILEALGFPRRPEIAKAAKPYLRWDISGEGWPTIGQTVIHAQKGFDGVIETMPFTCEPEVVAMNILPRVSREHNIPVITFIFDEQSAKAGMKTRLEAFVDLLERRRDIRESAARLTPAKELPRTLLGEDVCNRCPVLATCCLPVKQTHQSNCAQRGTLN